MPDVTRIDWEAARQHLAEFADDTRESLLWILRILMGWALAVAAGKTYAPVNEFVRAQSNAIDVAYVLLCWLSFLLAFFRFYFGDIRYFDRRTRRLKRLLASKRSPKYILPRVQRVVSARRQIVDITHAMIIGSLFVCLAEAVGDPRTFVVLYFVLILINALWLALSIVLNRVTMHEVAREEGDQVVKRTESPREDKVPRLWLINNLLFCLSSSVLLYGFGVGNGSSMTGTHMLILIGAGIGNSVADIILTFRHYFPQTRRLVVEDDEEFAVAVGRS